MQPGSREIPTASTAITWLGAVGEHEATGTVVSTMLVRTTPVMYLPDARLFKLHWEMAISKSARSPASLHLIIGCSKHFGSKLWVQGASSGNQTFPRNLNSRQFGLGFEMR